MSVRCAGSGKHRGDAGWMDGLSESGDRTSQAGGSVVGDACLSTFCVRQNTILSPALCVKQNSKSRKGHCLRIQDVHHFNIYEF